MRRSPVFLAMFTAPLEESSTGILKLFDVNYNTANAALHYIYTSEIRKDYAIEVWLVFSTRLHDKICFYCGLFLDESSIPCHDLTSPLAHVQEESESLLFFADKYDVLQMKEDIEASLKGILNPKNAFRFLGLAYKFKLTELETMAAAVVQSNFMSKEVSTNLRVRKWSSSLLCLIAKLRWALKFALPENYSPS